MMMHHDAQPLRSKDDIKGLLNQIRFLRQAGAVSLQCTLANPIQGSRWISEAITQGQVFERVGGKKVEDRDYDGNHVVASVHPRPWQLQRNQILAYAAFYNPVHFFKSIWIRNRRVRNKKVFYQVWGMVNLVRMAWSLKGYIWRLWRGPIERMKGWPERYLRTGSPYAESILNKAKLNTSESSPVPSTRPEAPSSMTKHL